MIVQSLLAAAMIAAAQSDSIFRPTDSLPQDRKFITGTLPNGMRYFIRRNDLPKKRAELRLVVNAGSVQESENQLGYAHFIEHMAFNGTAHFQKNDLVTTLQSLGVRFGADLNAQTSFDETIYILPIPTDQPRIVDIALTILSDWASGQRFDSAEVVNERGVVREEWRGNTGANDRMLRQWLPVALDGSIYARRLPIGTEQSIMSANPSGLKAYYNSWYRPDLMAIVAVGDFVPAQMEEQIRRTFSSIPRRSTPASRSVGSAPSVDSTRIVIASDPEAQQTTLSIWSRAMRSRLKTVQDYRDNLVTRVFLQILNERLGEDAQRSNPPFIQASAGRQALIARDIVSFYAGARVKRGGADEAVEAIISEIARVSEKGVERAELERSRARLLERYHSANAEIATTPSGVFAQEYIRSFLLNEPSPGADYEYRLVRQLLPGITAEEVRDVARRWATEKDRVVIVEAPAKDTVGLSRAEIARALVNGAQVSALSSDASDASTPMIESLQPAGSIMNRKSVAAVGVTEWKLSNGARVLFKPTDFQTDEVLFGAFAEGGTSLAPDSNFVSAAVSSQLVSLSGLGEHSLIELQRQLAGKSVSVSTSIGESTTEMSGRSSVDHLETLLQLVYLEFTAARVDTAAFARYIANVRSSLANRAASPDAVFSDTIQVTMSQNAFRSRPMTESRLAELDPFKSVAFFKDRVADASAFTFVFVGNVDSAMLAPLVARYLASLPVAKAKERAPRKEPGPPTGVISKTVSMGLEPRASTIIIFSGKCSYAPADRFALRALTDAFQLQLIRTLREQLGRTYSPSVRGTCIPAPRNQYSISIQFTSAPADADTLAATVLQLVQDMKAKGPDESDVQTVKQQMRRLSEVNARQNSFWLASIMLREYVHEDLKDILSQDQRIATLTSRDIKQAAALYFNTQNYARFVLKPQN